MKWHILCIQCLCLFYNRVSIVEYDTGLDRADGFLVLEFDFLPHPNKPPADKSQPDLRPAYENVVCPLGRIAR